MRFTRYIFRMYVPLLLGTLSLFVLGFEIVDLFMNIWKYLFNAVPVKVVMHILLLYIPKTVTFALPLSMLFSTCYMLCILSSQNELIAVFASGISYIKLMMPLFIFAFAMSLSYFVFEDRVVVPCYKKYQELKNTALHIVENADNTNIVIRSENGKMIYKVQMYNDSEKKMYGLLIVIRGEDNSLDSIVLADSALWNDTMNCWMLTSPVLYKVDENGGMHYSSGTEHVEPLLTEKPEVFKNNRTDVETISIKDAREYIRYLQRTGLPSGEALSVYYKKFSFSYIMLIVTFLAVGLSGRSRKNVIVVSMMLSLAAAVSFYVLQMITMLLAKFGIVTPAVGAWFPVVVFMAISFALLKYSRT